MYKLKERATRTVLHGIMASDIKFKDFLTVINPVRPRYRDPDLARKPEIWGQVDIDKKRREKMSSFDTVDIPKQTKQQIAITKNKSKRHR
jgi:hypothetical protein